MTQHSTALEKVKELTRLNEQLVEARRARNEHRQAQLKQQIEEVMRNGVRQTHHTPTASQSAQGPIEETVKRAPTASSPKSSTAMDLMKELTEINMRIVDARKRDAHEEAQRLQKRAQEIMRKGIAST